MYKRHCMQEWKCQFDVFLLHIFAGKPEVFVYPERIVVTEFNDVQVICNGSGIPNPTLTWKRLLGNRPKNMVVSRNGLMKIRNARTTESGIYQCTATNIIGSSSKSSFIVIIRGELFVWRLPDRKFCYIRRWYIGSNLYIIFTGECT